MPRFAMAMMSLAYLTGDAARVEVSRMAHMHNFTPTRQKRWQRMVGWMQMQANALA